MAECIKTLVSNPADLISKPELHPGNPECGKGEVTPQADPDYHTAVHIETQASMQDQQ